MTSFTAHGFPLASLALACMFLCPSSVALKQTTPYGKREVVHLGNGTCSLTENGFGFLADDHLQQMFCRDYNETETPTSVEEKIAVMTLDGWAPNPRHFMCGKGAPKDDEWMWAKQCAVYGAGHPMIAKNAGDWAVGCGYGNLLGSYCFVSGFCEDSFPINGTSTLAQSTEYCNINIGREKYANVGFKEAKIELKYSDALKKGFNEDMHTLKVTYDSVFCATGSYHCAADYCQQSFCKDPEYIAKFGKLPKISVY